MSEDGDSMPASVPQRRPHVGLRNLGNTCFVNSALQVVFGSSVLMRRLRDHARGTSGARCIRQSCTACAVFKDYTMRAMAPWNSATSMSPAATLALLQRLMPGMAPGSQQDSLMFLLSLLGAMNDELGDLKIIFGEQVDKTVCKRCANVTEVLGPCNYIPVQAKPSLDRALNAYFKSEELTGDDKRTCQECSRRSDVTRSCKLRIPPEILIVQLARFEFVGGEAQRITTTTLFPMQLNVGQFRDAGTMPRPEDELRYVGAVVHSGQSPNQGHYRAVGAVDDGDVFYLFDDSVVRIMSREEALERNDVHFAVYERAGGVADERTESVQRPLTAAAPRALATSTPLSTQEGRYVPGVTADKPGLTYRRREPQPREYVPVASPAVSGIAAESIQRPRAFAGLGVLATSTPLSTPEGRYVPGVTADKPGMTHRLREPQPREYVPAASSTVSQNTAFDALVVPEPVDTQQRPPPTPLSASPPKRFRLAGPIRTYKKPKTTTSTPIQPNEQPQRAVGDVTMTEEDFRKHQLSGTGRAYLKSTSHSKSGSLRPQTAMTPAATLAASSSSSSFRVTATSARLHDSAAQARFLSVEDESLAEKQLFDKTSSIDETRLVPPPAATDAVPDLNEFVVADAVARAVAFTGGWLSPLGSSSPPQPKPSPPLTPSPCKRVDPSCAPSPQAKWTSRSDPGASLLRTVCRPTLSMTTLTTPWSDSSEEEARDRLPAPTCCHEPVPVRPMSCLECGLGFRNQTALQRHLLRHSLLRLTDHRHLSCPHCSDTFPAGYLLHRHMRLHVGGDEDTDVLQCPRKSCKVMYRNPARMKRHFLLGHSRDHPKDDNPKRKRHTHDCRTCNARFEDCKTLRRHCRVYGEIRTRPDCKSCKAKCERRKRRNDLNERIRPWEMHRKVMLCMKGM